MRFGLWKTTREWVHAAGYIIEREDGSGFCATCTEDEAVLTAAAPEMLEALRMLTKWFDPTGASYDARWNRLPPEDRAAIVKASIAAVRKAEGRA